MSDTKISALTSGIPAQSADLLPIARNVSGTETNYNVTATSIAALAGGVFYASQYAGATADVQVNACIAAAIAAGNGICDARSLIGAQTIAAQINVGNSSNAPVTLLLPSYATWTTTISDGVSCAIMQYSYTNIVGGDIAFRMQIKNGSSTNGLYCLYTNAGGGYYRASGFMLYNTSVSMAGPAAMIIAGAFDNSVYRDIEVANYVGTGIQIGGSSNPCCSVGMYNITSNGNFTGGIPVNILGSNSGGTPNGIYFFGGSFDHPSAGLPNIACTDTSSLHNTTVGFFGVYEEGGNADTTTALNQVSGCGSVTVVGMEVKAETVNSVAPVWTISNTTNTSFQIMGLAAIRDFTYPATAVVNNFTGQTVQTDASGYLSQYNSGTTYLNSTQSGQYFTNGNCSSAASPAICGSASAGSVAIPAGSTTLTVNTSAVTANSQIVLQADDTLGTKLGVTCNSTLATLVGGLAVTARTAGTSFQISYNGTIVSNPLCISYTIHN